MSGSSPTRNASPLVTVLLTALGIALAVIGVIYLAATADHLPSFFPGHQAGNSHHHTKHALLAFGLAVLAWIGAWMSAGKKTPR
jgi:amino acid permease